MTFTPSLSEPLRTAGWPEAEAAKRSKRKSTKAKSSNRTAGTDDRRKRKDTWMKPGVLYLDRIGTTETHELENSIWRRTDKGND